MSFSTGIFPFAGITIKGKNKESPEKIVEVKPEEDVYWYFLAKIQQFYSDNEGAL